MATAFPGAQPRSAENNYGAPPGVKVRPLPDQTMLQNFHPAPIALRKQISDEHALEKFKETSRTSASLKQFIAECASAVEGCLEAPSLGAPGGPEAFEGLAKAIIDNMFTLLGRWVDEIPLQDMRKQRFGNKAFRDFIARLGELGLTQIIEAIILPCLDEAAITNTIGKNPPQPPPLARGAGAGIPAASDAKGRLAQELRDYLCDAFGNAQRIDFGTGHELHFFMFMSLAVLCLPVSAGGGSMETHQATAAALTETERETLVHRRRDGLRIMVLHVMHNYLAFCRRLQAHYSLEPAGSHGVWGLDDYHHLPYLFGAAQLVGHEAQFIPKDMTSLSKCSEYAKQKLIFFEMVLWIHENKKGPFFEHSPILYNITDIQEWPRIVRGLTRMYDAEVLGKYAVMQHLLFGCAYPF